MPSPRLRVLHVGKFYAPHRGGMETHLQTLCEGLRASVDLTVVVASPDRHTTREVVDGVPVTRVGTLVRLKGTSISPALARAIRARGRVDPVVVDDVAELLRVLPDVLEDGDLLLMMGAGDIGHAVQKLADEGFPEEPA